MKLIKRKFDYVIPLGGFCQTAYQVQRKGLRKYAFPFDWLVCEDNQKFIDCIQSSMKNWILKENCKTINNRDEKYYNIIDLYYGFEHPHIFPISNSFDISYELEYPKILRRKERFLKIPYGSKILFVRTKISVHEGQELLKSLNTKFGANIALIIVNHTYNFKFIEKKIQKNLISFNIYDEDEHTGQRWQGYDKHWDKIFSRFKYSIPLSKNRNRINKQILNNQFIDISNYGGRHIIMLIKFNFKTKIFISNVNNTILQTTKKLFLMHLYVNHETRKIKFNSNIGCFENKQLGKILLIL